MGERISIGNLAIEKVLHDLVNEEIIPGTGVEPATFWQGFEQILATLVPRNRELLAVRDDFQAKIDQWHRANSARPHDAPAYLQFLQEIGYLLEEGDDFAIETDNVDAEIALLAGPQLVVPVMNARYALNAANARWGSLYDALYGTDVIPETAGAEKGRGYNPVRGAQVIEYAANFLNDHLPLAVI